jgi:hypothetical protein
MVILGLMAEIRDIRKNIGVRENLDKDLIDMF